MLPFLFSVNLSCFRLGTLLLILPSCMAVENLAPSSQHASCRPAANICSGNPHLATFPTKSHLHTIQNHYMPAPYAGHGPLLLALPEGAPPHSCFGTSNSENSGASPFLDQMKLQGQLLPDLVTRCAEQLSIFQEAL